MKTLTKLAIILFFGITAFGNLHANPLHCVNCEITVELDDVGANALVDILPTLSSMPLDAEVLQWFPGSGRTKIRVATLPKYALEHKITSFDVANRVLALVKSHSQWRLWNITAIYNGMSATNNVGTIGN